MLAPLGRLMIFGLSAAATGERRNAWRAFQAWRDTASFNPMSLINRNHGVFGLHIGHLWEEGRALAAADDDADERARRRPADADRRANVSPRARRRRTPVHPGAAEYRESGPDHLIRGCRRPTGERRWLCQSRSGTTRTGSARSAGEFATLGPAWVTGPKRGEPLESADYFRCLPTSLVISNMLTVRLAAEHRLQRSVRLDHAAVLLILQPVLLDVGPQLLGDLGPRYRLGADHFREFGTRGHRPHECRIRLPRSGLLLRTGLPRRSSRRSSSWRSWPSALLQKTPSRRRPGTQHPTKCAKRSVFSLYEPGYPPNAASEGPTAATRPFSSTTTCSAS